MSATANDPEDGILSGSSIQWYSDLVGPANPIASGQRATIEASSLALGRHIITAVATDSFGAQQSHSRPIQITQGPIVQIQEPGRGRSYNGETIPLQVDVTKWIGGAVPNTNIVWYAIRDGDDRSKRTLIGTGRRTSTHTAALGVDNFEILVIATTTDDLEGHDSVFISVTG